MADGPRSLRPEEWPQLEALVSTVFRSRMVANYPQFFNEENRENLRIVADNDRVVCHVGVMQRPASLLGCRLDIACVGAVATDPDYRGRGHASAAFQDCCDRAAASGCDLMLISGGRSLYTRVGCRQVGRDWDVVLDATTGEAGTHLPPVAGLQIRALDGTHLPDVAAIYQTEPVRFLRPWEDWPRAFACRIVMAAHADFWGLFLADHLLAYLIVQPPDARRPATKPPSVRVVEYAGDRAAVVSALSHLRSHYQAKRIEIHVPGWDVALRLRLEQVGCPATPSPTWGTLRVLNFPQCMERCRPLLTERLGAGVAAALRFEADERAGSATGGFTIRSGSRQLRLPDLGTLASFLFGGPQELVNELPDGDGLGALLAPALPLPALWYGISYV